MRKFEVLVAMTIEAQSFAGAESKVHRIMTSAWDATDGDVPKNFQTLSITKGLKVQDK